MIGRVLNLKAMAADYEFQLQLILSAIAQGSHDLDDIARKSGGLYPLELLGLIDELVNRGLIEPTEIGYQLASYAKIDTSFKEQATRRQLNCPNPVGLPLPHPLDYDWRFSNSTSKSLAQLIVTSSLPNSQVLLLGTPSVFVEVAQLPNAPATTLIDWNEELINHLGSFPLPSPFRLINSDLMSDSFWVSESYADLVLCDPPWYPEYYTAFLIQAAQATQIGAKVVISLLPIITRPNATADRWKIIKDAHELGFHIEQIEPLAITYETPTFELTSLQAAGIKFQNNWRPGDILVLRKVHHPNGNTIRKFTARAKRLVEKREEWRGILIGEYKVKIRGPFQDYDIAPELISIEKNDVLPTVSRRYEGRKRVDLWLWDNRVFAVRGKSAFWAALLTLTGRNLPKDLTAAGKRNHDLALDLLRRVIQELDQNRSS